MSNSTADIAAVTAALFPDAVKEAFAKKQSLTMRDLLLLESADVKFVALGIQPSAYEMAAFLWLMADRAAFASALDTGTFRDGLHAWADTLSPSVIPSMADKIAAVIRASFAPLDGSKKKTGTGRKP